MKKPSNLSNLPNHFTLHSLFKLSEICGERHKRGLTFKFAAFNMNTNNNQEFMVSSADLSVCKLQ